VGERTCRLRIVRADSSRLKKRERDGERERGREEVTEEGGWEAWPAVLAWEGDRGTACCSLGRE
jgi:hypothetical protein